MILLQEVAEFVQLIFSALLVLLAEDAHEEWAQTVYIYREVSVFRICSSGLWSEFVASEFNFKKENAHSKIALTLTDHWHCIM